MKLILKTLAAGLFAFSMANAQDDVPADAALAAAPSQNVPQTQAPADKTVSLGDWVLTILVSMIPIVGLIMLFVWGFGSASRSKKNWARAMLIWEAVFVVLAIALVATGVISYNTLAYRSF